MSFVKWVSLFFLIKFLGASRFRPEGPIWWISQHFPVLSGHPWIFRQWGLPLFVAQASPGTLFCLSLGLHRQQESHRGKVPLSFWKEPRHKNQGAAEGIFAILSCYTWTRRQGECSSRGCSAVCPRESHLTQSVTIVGPTQQFSCSTQNQVLYLGEACFFF